MTQEGPKTTSRMQIEYNDNWIANNPELFVKSFLQFKKRVEENGLTLKKGATSYPGPGFTTFTAS